MEITGEQLKRAESLLERYLPQSLQVYGALVYKNRSITSDPVNFFVDKWPDFSVIVCKPQYEEKGDLFKDAVVFAKDEVILAEILKKSSVIDWTRYLWLELDHAHTATVRAVAKEKDALIRKSITCHMMILEDVSKLPSVDSSEITLGSLDESHVGLVNQTWKFATDDNAARMIRDMLANFPSCCVLDAGAKPVSWIVAYSTGAMGMLYTLPEHRGKGYAKVVVSAMAKKLHAQGCPLFCFIEEENKVSYRLFTKLGFTENPKFRASWHEFNYF